MAEYIDREALDKSFVLLGYDEKDLPRRMLHHIPAADVAPVVRGEWIDSDSAVFKPWCSSCLSDSPIKGYTPKFCPNCGAKMNRRR